MRQANGELPEGWIEVKLGNLAPQPTDIAYGVLKPGDQVSGGVPMLRVKDIRENQVDGSEVYRISEELDRQYQRTRLAGGELLVSIQGTVGRVAVVPSEFANANISRTLARVPLAEPSLGAWLHAALLSPQMQRAMTDRISGTTRDSLNLSELREIAVRVPPFPEQLRILAKIKELQTRTRLVREALTSVPALLERFCKSMLESAFRGDLTAGWRERQPVVEPASVLLEQIRLERRRKWEEAELAKLRVRGKEPNNDRWKQKYQEPEPMDTGGLPELPRGWTWTTLADVGSWSSGGTPSRSRADYYGGGIPWVKTGELPDGPVCETEETLTQLGVEESSAKVLPPGTILVAMYGATIGKLGILQMNAATNQACAALLPDGFRGIDRDFVFFFLLSQREKLKRLGQGGAQPNISQALLKEYPIPIPPAAEQHLIVLAVREALSRAKHAGAAAEAAAAKLGAIDASVLAKAFGGDLVPQDSNDEPASLLLARLRPQPVPERNPSKRSRGGKRGPRPKTKADTNMLTRRDVAPTHLSMILKERGALTAEALWAASQLEIDDFYDQLKAEEVGGLLRENRGDAPNAPTLLEPPA